MKPTRKLNRGSFMSRVAGKGEPKSKGGHGKGAVESDHDLAYPEPAGAGEAGADPDSGPR
ncbi:MAG TPA: hypothetical protein VIT38_08030 [Allosphingosinicella sp.]